MMLLLFNDYFIFTSRQRKQRNFLRFKTILIVGKVKVLMKYQQNSPCSISQLTNLMNQMKIQNKKIKFVNININESLKEEILEK